jgi:hypothetical protein
MAVIEAIETTYLETSSATSVIFASIPATYEHLQLRISSHDLYASGYDWIYLRLNSDSGTNYSSHNVEGYSSSETAQAQTGATYARLGVAQGAWQTVGAVFYSPVVIDIFDYANTNKTTTMTGLGGVCGTQKMLRQTSSLWEDTAAVNRIEVYVFYTEPFQRGTSLTLYGLNSS